MKMTSKLFALVAAAFMLVGAFAVAAELNESDAEVGATFTVGEFTFTVLSEADGETVGTVALTSATPAEAGEEITVPVTATNATTSTEYNVVQINAGAFGSTATYEKVTIPASVAIEKDAFKWTKVIEVDVQSTAVRGGAFNYSSGIETVTWHGQPILGNTFDNATNLTTFNGWSTVTSVAAGGFTKCAKLSGEVDLSNATTIGYKAFIGCTSISSLKLPADLSSGTEAFRDCTGLEDVEWAGTSIPSMYFYGCTKLDLDISKVETFGSYCLYNTAVSSNPDAAVTIGDHAFMGCKITSLTLDASKTTFGANAFEKNTLLTQVTLTNFTQIPSAMFASCSALAQDLDLSNVTAIGSSAFYGCPLTGVTLSESLTTIEASTFRGSNFRSITIPESVTTIGADAFRNSQLKEIISQGTATVGAGAFPPVGYVYSSGATLTAWSPEIPSQLAATTYTASVSGGNPVSIGISEVYADKVYAPGDKFTYDGISLILTYDDGSTGTIASTDEGFEGVTFYSDDTCQTVYVPGTTELTAEMTALYVKYGEYATEPAVIELTIIQAEEYDPDKSIDEQLAEGNITIPATARIVEDITLVQDTEILFHAGSKITGSVSYAEGTIQFVDAMFAYNTLISAGSVEIMGAVGSGMIIFEGTDNVISSDFTVGAGVVVVYKDAAVITVNEGATFTIPAGAYVQDFGATINAGGAGQGTYNADEAVVLEATDFINEDNNEVTGVDYTAGFRVDLTLSDDFVIDQSYTRTVFWYLVNQEDPSVVYHDSATIVAGATNVSLYYGALAQRGSYDLYMVVYRDVVVDPTVEYDAVIVGASSSITVNFLDEGWMIGLYIDDTGAYHAVVMNFGGDILEGAVTTNAYATVELDVGETDPITYVKAVATDLTATIGEDDVDDVDFNMGDDTGVTGDIIGFQLRYDCSAQTDGFVMRSQQILDAGNTAEHESAASGDGALEAVLYFAMVDSDDDGTAETPVIYVYSAVDINDATITLWYNDGSDNLSVTATISVVAGTYEIFEYSIFDGAQEFDPTAVTLMSAYISFTAEGETDASTTLEVLAY